MFDTTHRKVIADELADLLVAKNKAYGNSALDPVRIFSTASPHEQLLVRVDDKLSRLARGNDAGEDTLMDLLGYLVIMQIEPGQEFEPRVRSICNALASTPAPTMVERIVSRGSDGDAQALLVDTMLSERPVSRARIPVLAAEVLNLLTLRSNEACESEGCDGRGAGRIDGAWLCNACDEGRMLSEADALEVTAPSKPLVGGEFGCVWHGELEGVGAWSGSIREGYGMLAELGPHHMRRHWDDKPDDRDLVRYAADMMTELMYQSLGVETESGVDNVSDYLGRSHNG